MNLPEKLIFLPGASGQCAFWEPVATRLNVQAAQCCVGWPGFGPTPPNPAVQGFDDLVGLVCKELDRPSALIAQSMGGVAALHAALQRPEMLTHLVLAATAGGIDMSGVQAEDWRPAFHAANPAAPRWLSDYHQDLSDSLRRLAVPTLLIWGEADPISPPAIGRRFAGLLPQSQFILVPKGGHDCAGVFAESVAWMVDEFLTS